MLKNSDDIHVIIIDIKEYKLGQYADDTHMFFNGGENSLRETLYILQKVYTKSWRKIYFEKKKNTHTHTNKAM